MLRIASVFIALMVLGGSNTARAQSRDSAWYKKAHSWSVYEENDGFTPTGSDREYTQGFQIKWNYSTWKRRWNTTFAGGSLLVLIKRYLPKVDAVIECQKPDTSPDGGCGGVFFGLGQTIYTPSNLLLDALQPKERPYAGYSAVNFGMSARYAHGLVTSQMMVGTTGPRSGAQEVQSLAHWTWSHPRAQPQGWSHQLRDAWQLALVNQYSGRFPIWWMEQCASRCNGSRDEGRIYDLTPRLELDLGTPMTRASAGAVVRLGYGFPNLFNPDRIPVTYNPDRIPVTVASTLSPSASFRWKDDMSCSLCQAIASQKPWGMIFGTLDGRAIAWNQLLSGTYNDRGANGWNSVKQIETNHLGWEASGGVAVGANFATLIYQRVGRGKEYYPNGRTHWYGSLTFTVHSAPSASLPP